MRAWVAVVVAIGLIAPAAAQDAQTFPTRAIRIIVPFPAGGPTDVNARILGQKMSEDWKQPVVIENAAPAATPRSAPSWSQRPNPTATRCSPRWTPRW